MAKIATDFNKIINAGRERKKNEDLAAKIFGTKGNRRASAPGKASGAGAGSLASRVGVKKAGARGAAAAAPVPAGNINGEWTHDLHGARSTPNLRARGQQQQQKQQAGGALAARIHAPGTKPAAAKGVPTGPRNNANNRAAKLANAVSRTPGAQMNIAHTSSAPSRGLSIRGLAGPYAIMAQNFAPGTTAADIESAMTPIGGIIQSCRLLKVQPIVIAEVTFESKEGADRVIETFNNQTADGRMLHVYHKPAGDPNYNPPSAPRAQRSNESRTGSGVVVDGSNGFDEPMDMNYNSDSGLYSDRLVNSNRPDASRRGRGFQNRGRGR
ncbi:hypothetical protein BJ166DRAFT_522225 [Pestalotiopsis sp. NC0098]|nr:hypothetical protein BJ166DRAFT_522225 [Pestalotiopsis sp. NC0098]